MGGGGKRTEKWFQKHLPMRDKRGGFRLNKKGRRAKRVDQGGGKRGLRGDQVSGGSGPKTMVNNWPLKVLRGKKKKKTRCSTKKKKKSIGKPNSV